LATTKRGAGGGSGRSDTKKAAAGKERPRLRSSHEGAATKRSANAEVRTAIVSGPRTRKARVPTQSPALSSSVASDESRELAVAIAVAALDKKASGLEILDVAGRVDYADFLVLMTGRSDRQVAALAQGIEEALRKKNRRPLSVEGLQHASWVLMDFGDVVVHVFQDDARSLYDIDGLWLDARRLPVPVPEGMPSGANFTD
jgi:ribosome-associated protein